MKVLITGASGLIGKALQKSFAEKGYEMLLASRKEPTDEQHIQWSIETGFADPEKLEGIDAVVHLAGENVSGLRWTDDKKKAIRDSRVLGTRNVVNAISKLKKNRKFLSRHPRSAFTANAATKRSPSRAPPGDNFLAEVSKDGKPNPAGPKTPEFAPFCSAPASFLSKDGGALATMLTPFKLGVGGVVGSGKQWMSWISLDDEIAVINYAIENENLRGAVNAVSPNPVTNHDFTKTLGEVLYRPTFLPLPEFAVSMVFGEMGDALLLASTKVLPKRLEDAGFEFKYPDLKAAIEHAVK